MVGETIDNVMFFSKELSFAEVKRLYNNGHGTEILAEVEQQRIATRIRKVPRYER